MYRVELSYDLVSEGEPQPGIRNRLVTELEAIRQEQSLQKAAKKLGVSYRYLWGSVEDWEKKFGSRLIIREQGRPARLSPLGERLLWAEHTVKARHSIELAKIKSELTSAFAMAQDPDAAVLRFGGCFDPWIAQLPAALFPEGTVLMLDFTTSLKGLKDMAAGKCDIAGFNFPLGAGKSSAAAASFAGVLNPALHEACRFCLRSQGLAVAPGNPHGIASIGDVVAKNLRYAGRQPGSGTSVLLHDLLVKENLDPAALDSPALTEQSHRAVATAVASGKADAGLCVASAAKASGADFVPLASESYCLAWRKTIDKSLIGRLLGAISKDAWKGTASHIAGVDAWRCGEKLDLKTLGWWN
ncbi:MAG: Transcriptional regulator, LysR family [Burkholderia sp.]|jgi:putative molybdopterin biosynthesis protein